MVSLSKSPQTLLRNQNPKKPCPRAPNNIKGDLSMAEIKYPGEPQGIYPTLRKLVDSPSTPPLPPYPATLYPQNHPTVLYLLQLIPGGDRAHILF
jgi:hypothetical protein